MSRFLQHLLIVCLAASRWLSVLVLAAGLAALRPLVVGLVTLVLGFTAGFATLPLGLIVGFTTFALGLALGHPREVREYILFLYMVCVRVFSGLAQVGHETVHIVEPEPNLKAFKVRSVYLLMEVISP